MPLFGRNKSGKHLNPNSAHPRVFIASSFADVNKVNFLRRQRETSKSFDFTDYSIREPYKIGWKKSAEYRIKVSDAVIVAVSENSLKSESVKYEMGLAEKYEKPIIPIKISKELTSKTINGKRVVDWNCENVQKKINNAKKKR